MEEFLKQFNKEELLNIFEVASFALTDSICLYRIECLSNATSNELKDLQRKLEAINTP